MMLFSLTAILSDLWGICEEVNFYYTEEGYPLFVSEPIKEGVAGDLETAKELVKRILEEMK
ncbi:hypothetical protein C5S31_09125 [ANME-1 cluster archaeon GoMg2]|nr:hypothetical protein [ANME-1 cluster archaeon GoMg2]